MLNGSPSVTADVLADVEMCGELFSVLLQYLIKMH